MKDLLRLREQYKDGFATRLPDGQHVPWRPLTVSEYLGYERLLQVGTYPRAFVENEIFSKCVLDSILVENIGKLRAGMVTTVVCSIMAHSGPQSLEDLNNLLNVSRMIANQAIHEMVGMVCTAFPAYTPDVLYELDYETLMLRVAQAERKLLSSGVIQKPLELEVPQAEGGEKVKPPRPPSPEKLATMWQQRQEPQPRPVDAGKRGDTRTVIGKNEMLEHHAAYTGHEKEDRIVLENQMVKTTAGFYGDYLKQIEGGKEVRIKTTEERVAEAEARAKRSEVEYNTALAKKKAEREKLEKTLEERRSQRAAKRKKR